MRSRTPLLAAFTLAAIGNLTLSMVGGVAKPRVEDFIIGGNDGYGTQECLSNKSSCGRIVADAWCEAKGFKAAQSYRALAPDEITASITQTQRKHAADSFVITCAD